MSLHTHITTTIMEPIQIPSVFLPRVSHYMEECGLIREDKLSNYPDCLAYGQGLLPEPLELYNTKDDTIRTLRRELEELRKENHKLKTEVETKKLIEKGGT